MKKNTVIIIVLVVVFAVLIGGGVLAYSLLAPEVSKPIPTETPTYIHSSDDEEIVSEAETGSKEPATDFTVYDNNGNAVNLSDHFGKPLVVNFWATWCPPCCEELPHFDALAQEMNGEVEFMMVNLTDDEGENAENTRQFLAENGYTFPVYYDDDQSAANAYFIEGIPTTLFIDAEGNIVAQQVGAMDEATLRAYIEQIQ